MTVINHVIDGFLPRLKVRLHRLGATLPRQEVGRRVRFYALGGLFALAVAYFFSGVGQVPFHPDESTQLFYERRFRAAVYQSNGVGLES
jgi:hypothetical protein